MIKSQLTDKSGNQILPMTHINCVIDAPNVVSERVIDEDTFGDFGKLTREDLKKDLFIDLWNKACGSYGKYNVETGYFELNELIDITYEEAIVIYQASSVKRTVPTNMDYMFRYGGPEKPRTLLPIRYEHISTAIGAFSQQTSLETVRLLPADGDAGTISNSSSMFYNCPKLRKILGELKIQFPWWTNKIDGMFFYCHELEEIRIARIGKPDISFAQSSKLSYASFKYMVDNSITKYYDTVYPVTITVHPDVYNAITGSAIYPFNGGTKEEWLALNELAISKQITFATA